VGQQRVDEYEPFAGYTGLRGGGKEEGAEEEECLFLSVCEFVSLPYCMAEFGVGGFGGFIPLRGIALWG